MKTYYRIDRWNEYDSTNDPWFPLGRVETLPLVRQRLVEVMAASKLPADYYRIAEVVERIVEGGDR
jgi:hypothetical protein